MSSTAGEACQGKGRFSSRALGRRTGAVVESGVIGSVPELRGKPAPVLQPQKAGVSLMSAEWPRSHRLSLAALPEAVPTARIEVKVLLIEWNAAILIEPTELCAAELVSNAIKAVNDLHPDLRQPIAFRMSSDYARLVLEVWDCNPKAPERAHPDEASEDGRGLLLVEAYSDRWDYYVTPQWGGKVVWCELSAIAATRATG